MNPAHRDGWPPTQASVSASSASQTMEQGQGQAPRPLGSYSSSNANQQQPPQAPSGQGAGPVLPPPSANYFPSNQTSGHNLPGLNSLTQATQASPSQSAQRPASSNQESAPATQHHQGAGQGSGYSLPGISQTLQPQIHPAGQTGIDRERELRERENREREIMEAHAAQEEIVKREVEARDRELRERQHNGQAALENLAGPLPIHQPVAVAPSSRTIHGPNGLLGNSGPLNGPNAIAAALGGPNGPANLFANPPMQQNETTSRIQHSVQPAAQQSILMPFGGPGMQPGPMAAMGQGQQPILNDALSYLDQVKVQFADHPDVYNRFLDIMKDFKSGAIDTPGVIERVSTLFAGNPNLIQGFNTFLPPGYKIECGTESDPNAIRVTTPMGTMVSTMPAPRPLSAPRSTAINGNPASINDSGYYESGPSRHWQQGRAQGQEGQEQIFSPNNRTLGQALFSAQAQGPQAPLSPELARQNLQEAPSGAAALAHQQEQRGVSQLQNAVSAATGRSILSPSGESATPLPGQAVNGAGVPAAAGAGGEKRGPVEFNHAISYVNKIKNRFASQPDIYKQFLEILQTYQRESKPIQDVYAQVTTLFGSAPDLLEDFKQFLPESAAQHRAQQQAARHAAEDSAMLSNVRGEPSYQQAQQHHQTPRADTSRLPPMGNFAPTPTANRDNKRKRAERQAPGATTNAMANSVAPEATTSNARAGYGQGNIAKRTKTAHNAKQPMGADGPPVSPTLTPALPEPLPPNTTTVANHDELAFFDRVKKHLGNKNQMSEFLKLCNLFSQDLIDKNLLLQRIQSFIGGNPDLYAWFKDFLKPDEGEQLQRTKPRVVNSRVSLSNCRGLGPSYRLLPKRERERPCSGRDELCRSVLNDEWASHPTWASEDSGFVAHRKNQYEEGLHRIEEERHDYDFNIEALLRTVQQLEPIANQLLTMSAEDRVRFELPPGLGGQSTTIYQRVIKKIYGRDKGNEVIKELFEQPFSVIPVLLNRLKAKLEDWKAAQREWEKVWRDQTQKIFWKSLDHQSLISKQTDKRQFQPKTLQNEIQVRYEEQKRLCDIQEISQPEYQFSYSFKDEEVLFDATRLILTFAENNSGTDFSKVVPFIKEFVPLFFGLDHSKFEQRVQSFGRESSTNESADEDMASPDDGFSHKATKTKKPTLLRDVLDRGRSGKPGRRDKEDSIASGSRDSTPDVASAADDEAGSWTENGRGGAIKPEPTEGRWVEYAAGAEESAAREIGHEEPYRRSVFNLYANLPIYCFFRMFVILYERLLALKNNEARTRELVARASKWKAAHDLKMMDKLPSDFFSDTSDTANYYEQVLHMFEEQIKGEIDMGIIEETLRRYYLFVGYQLYSFDRLLSALVRFNLALFNNDSKERTYEIYQLFKKDRLNENTTHKAELTYRKAVEKYAKDADIYRIVYDPLKSEAYVRFFKRDEPTFDFQGLDKIKKWRAYVASYMTIEPTEDLDHTKVKFPFLKHSTNKASEEMGDELCRQARTEDKVTVKVSVEGYKIQFEPTDIGAGFSYIVQTDKIRTGVTSEDPNAVEEAKQLVDTKSELTLEKLVRNNAWMRDVSRDDVDARKDAYKKDVEEPKGLSDDDDEEMEDA